MAHISSNDADLMTQQVHIPEHVAVRRFDEECVALNLKSGQYFGLNGVAARMFERLGEIDTASEAIGPLAEEYGQDHSVIERDLAALLRDLAERGLVELGPAA